MSEAARGPPPEEEEEVAGGRTGGGGDLWAGREDWAGGSSPAGSASSSPSASFATAMSDQLGDSTSLPRDTEAGPDIASEEEFRPAAEVFKDPNAFDFLSQHGTGGAGAAAQLARESLYVKFDPLVAGRPSILPNGGSRDRHGKGAPHEDHEGDEQPRASSSSAREDSQEKEEDDLMALQSPSPKKPQLPPKPPVSKDDNQPANKSPESAKSLGPEQQMQFQEQLLKKETQIAELDRQVEGKLHALDRLKAEVRQRRESEDQMKQVLKEYEKTISELISEKEHERGRFEEERQSLKSERDQAVEDLHNVETAFADVHRKYERTKQVVEGFKHNEDTLKRAVQEQQMRLRKQEQKYELLKQHAEETLEKANREIESLTRQQDAEAARLTALLKKAEMKANGLERQVEQKAKENEELTAICDELIAKVGVGGGAGGT